VDAKMQSDTTVIMSCPQRAHLNLSSAFLSLAHWDHQYPLLEVHYLADPRGVVDQQTAGQDQLQAASSLSGAGIGYGWLVD